MTIMYFKKDFLKFGKELLKLIAKFSDIDLSYNIYRHNINGSHKGFIYCCLSYSS